LFRRKTSFEKQLIFQNIFSRKLTHFPVFGNNLQNKARKRFLMFGKQKKKKISFPPLKDFGKHENEIGSVPDYRDELVL
jgi:hypothetical protein